MSAIDILRYLPNAVYLQIQSFIPNDYKHFTNCSKLLLREIKYETIYYNLNQIFSFKFCQDESFRRLILSKVRHRRYQISLNLRQYTAYCEFQQVVTSQYHPNSSRALDYTGDVVQQSQSLCLHATDINRLKLQGIKSIDSLSPFANIPELVFYNFPNVISTSELQNVEKLTLNAFHNLITLTTLPLLQECRLVDCFALTDVSPLANVNILHLENCPQVVDITALGNHSRLAIILCGGAMIPDISTLGRVRKSIELVGFHVISDISVLRNIPDIKLRNFQMFVAANGFDMVKEEVAERASVTLEHALKESAIVSITLENMRLADYHALSLIRIMKFVNISNLTNESVSFLTNVQSLELIGCSNIRKIPFLLYLTKLKIKNIPALVDFQFVSHVSTVIIESVQIRDLTPLKPVRHLQIIGCDNIKSLDKLGNHASITITNIEFNSLIPIKNVPDVKLINCHRLRDNHIAELVAVEKLSVAFCQRFSETNRLGHLQSLHISYCSGLKKIVGLHDVKEVIIENCDNLVDISGLGNNDLVRLYKCSKVEDVRPLINVKEVKISHCKSITNIDCLRNVIKYVK